MMTAAALLHLESELAPGADVEAFGAWCDRHHREILTVPGFLRARRFVQVAADGPMTCLLTLYDLVDAAVLDGEAYAAHGRNHTPLPAALAGSLTFTRSVWTVLPPPGDRTAIGDALVWERSAAVDPGDVRTAQFAREPGVVGFRRFVPAERDADRTTTLTLVEVRSGDDLDAVARARPAARSGSRRAYRQVFDSEA